MLKEANTSGGRIEQELVLKRSQRNLQGSWIG